MADTKYLPSVGDRVVMQTACIVKLGERMRLLVELRGKSEVGRKLAVADDRLPDPAKEARRVAR